MTAAEILSELTARQVELRVAGDRLRFRPVSRVPKYLLDELRMRKSEVLELIGHGGWPTACLESEQRFGTPEARLFPLIGKYVATADGPGRLLQVFSERVCVVLERDPRQAIYLLPTEVGPLGREPEPKISAERIH